MRIISSHAKIYYFIIVILLLVSCTGEDKGEGNSPLTDSTTDTDGYGGGSVEVSMVMPQPISPYLFCLEDANETLSVKLGSSPLVSYASGSGTCINSFMTSTNVLNVTMDHYESTGDEFVSSISISIDNATAPQSYGIGSQTLFNLDYSADGNSTKYTAINGTITINSIGNEGEPITGSFDIILSCKNCTETMPATGTFSAKRITPIAPTPVAIPEAGPTAVSDSIAQE